MKLRPIVVDNNYMVLGGNKRLICLQNLGFKEIPDEWVVRADELTEDERKRFIIADNVGFGEWDMEVLQGWDSDLIEDWGIDYIMSWGNKKETFNDKINEYTDENCKMPIVPDFFEKHEAFIIVCHNEIDINFIRDVFDLNENFVSNSKDKKNRKTNVITVENIREWAQKYA